MNDDFVKSHGWTFHDPVMNKAESRLVSIKSCSACVKCAKCHTVCPVYAVVPKESHSARGKMALIEAAIEGNLESSTLLREYLELCLLCGACEEACPNLVPTVPVMFQAREMVADDVGNKAGKGILLNHLLGALKTFRLAMRTGRVAQRLVFRRIPQEAGLRRRFPMPLVPEDRTIPGVSTRFFTELASGTVREGTGPRVGIFAGCMVNYLYPETGITMIELLAATGATVVVPEDQACCGMPALAGGAGDTARELAVKNLEEFEKFDLDLIVTGCASCGSNLKENYSRLLEKRGVDPGRAGNFVSKIFDINEFMTGKVLSSLTEDELSGPVEKRVVTYHHPCHLARFQGIKDEPIRLIGSIPGVEFVPMEDADRCCGMGGSFSIEHYDISKRINDEKVDRIAETRAGTVVTSCPACILHIRDGLRRHGIEGVEVVHVVQLLAETIEARVDADRKRVIIRDHGEKQADLSRSP
ncbi:MAG: (Fe-S)-binding protein [bacterium]